LDIIRKLGEPPKRCRQLEQSEILVEFRFLAFDPIACAPIVLSAYGIEFQTAPGIRSGTKLIYATDTREHAPSREGSLGKWIKEEEKEGGLPDSGSVDQLAALYQLVKPKLHAPGRSRVKDDPTI
jgi:hypothetical protein